MAKEMIDKGYDIREVTDGVFRSRYYIVFDEVENTMYTIKAVIVATTIGSILQNQILRKKAIITSL